MKGTATRLNTLEGAANRAALAELARRYGVLKWVIVAADARQDASGAWVSDTVDLLMSLPPELYPAGLNAIGDDGAIEVRPQ